MQISKHFTLADLTKTTTGIANTPSASIVNQLKALGATLDYLYEKVGPFKIESAYRSPDVQSAIKEGAAGAASAAQAASKSYHSTGQAADIMPTTMSVDKYFAKIASNPTISSKMGGFALKNNVIHLDNDTNKRSGVAMYVDKAGQYIRFGQKELETFIAKNKTGIAIGSVVIAGLLGFIVYRLLTRSKVKTNPSKAYKKELAMGVATEAEEHHVGKKRAKQIAKDHLRENKRYYTKLKKAGL